MNFISFIFPRKCVLCGEMLTDGEKYPFCALFLAKYELLKREKCKTCGESECFCRCKARRLYGVRGDVEERHLFRFEDGVSRKIVYSFKRKNSKALRDFLSDECSELVSFEMSLYQSENFIISYPPRSKNGIKTYGFDQARTLALGISKRTGVPVENIFKRKRFGREQKNLSAAEREENADNLFYSAAKNDIRGMSLIIIDDVVTSGSTVRRLSELALIKGARRVIVISVSKV